MQSQGSRFVAAGFLGPLLIVGVLLWWHDGFKLDEDKGLYLAFFAVLFVNAAVDCLPASMVRIKRATGLIAFVALVAFLVLHFAQTGFRWELTPLSFGSRVAFNPDAIDLHDVLITHWYMALIVLYLPLMGLGWFFLTRRKAGKT